MIKFWATMMEFPFDSSSLEYVHIFLAGHAPAPIASENFSAYIIARNSILSVATFPTSASSKARFLSHPRFEERLRLLILQQTPVIIAKRFFFGLEGSCSISFRGLLDREAPVVATLKVRTNINEVRSVACRKGKAGFRFERIYRSEKSIPDYAIDAIGSITTLMIIGRLANGQVARHFWSTTCIC